MPHRALMLVVGAAAAIALGAIPANAQKPQVLRQNDTVAGRTVRAWTAPYAKWDEEREKPDNCQAGQRGRMFFLPSAPGGNTTARCAVDAGTPVMILPAGIHCVDDARYCLDPALRRLVKQVGVKIDGVPVRVRKRDWATKRGFPLSGGAGSTAGYYYVIDGLSTGAHRIVLFDRVEPPGEPVFRARITISLTVR